MQLVKTQKILYNQEFRIRLLADNNDAEYTRLISKLPGCRWSDQLNSWHVENIENHIQYFNKIFPSYIRFVSATPSRYILKVDENLKSQLQNTKYRIEFESAPEVKEDSLAYHTDNKEDEGKFRQFLVSSSYSIRTIDQYVNNIRQFWGSSVRPSILSIEGIRDYIDEMSINRNLSRSYQNQLINSLKVYYQYRFGKAIGRFELRRPRRDPVRPSILTKNEVSKIIKLIPNLKHNTLISTIYLTGITVGETVSIRPDDIDKESFHIYIRGIKDNSGRKVPVSAELIEKIDSYQNCYNPKNYLFEGHNGSRYTERSIQKVLKKYVQKAGIKKRASVQTLRHSFACNMAMQGMDVGDLQHMLGHSSRKSTEIYRKLVEIEMNNN